MELEGFGSSLVGRAILVHAAPDKTWIPWEFISATQYTCKILVCGDSGSLEAETFWTVILRPKTSRDWSILATILRGYGGTILLTFDSSAPKCPDSFLSFLDTLVDDGRTVCTRIWFGIGVEIPAIPDAVFFPPVVVADSARVYDLMKRLPARSNHGVWRPLADWSAVCSATVASDLGLMISDIDEPEWKVFWHKISDSVVGKPSDSVKRGITLSRLGLSLVERFS